MSRGTIQDDEDDDDVDVFGAMQVHHDTSLDDIDDNDDNRVVFDALNRHRDARHAAVHVRRADHFAGLNDEDEQDQERWHRHKQDGGNSEDHDYDDRDDDDSNERKHITLGVVGRHYSVHTHTDVSSALSIQRQALAYSKHRARQTHYEDSDESASDDSENIAAAHNDAVKRDSESLVLGKVNVEVEFSSLERFDARHQLDEAQLQALDLFKRAYRRRVLSLSDRRALLAEEHLALRYSNLRADNEDRLDVDETRNEAAIRDLEHERYADLHRAQRRDRREQRRQQELRDGPDMAERLQEAFEARLKAVRNRDKDEQNDNDTCDDAERKPLISFKPSFNVPSNILIPSTLSEHEIIERTANFARDSGHQAEMMLHVKQAHNPKFSFLRKDCPLYAYYCFVRTANVQHVEPPSLPPVDEVALSSLTNMYDSDEETQSKSRLCTTTLSHTLQPPSSVCSIITAMCLRISHYGLRFEDCIKQVYRSQSISLLSFLDDTHIFHPYYEHKRYKALPTLEVCENILESIVTRIERAENIALIAHRNALRVATKKPSHVSNVGVVMQQAVREAADSFVDMLLSESQSDEAAIELFTLQCIARFRKAEAKALGCKRSDAGVSFTQMFAASHASYNTTTTTTMMSSTLSSTAHNAAIGLPPSVAAAAKAAAMIAAASLAAAAVTADLQAPTGIPSSPTHNDNENIISSNGETSIENIISNDIKSSVSSDTAKSAIITKKNSDSDKNNEDKNDEDDDDDEDEHCSRKHHNRVASSTRSSSSSSSSSLERRRLSKRTRRRSHRSRSRSKSHHRHSVKRHRHKHHRRRSHSKQRKTSSSSKKRERSRSSSRSRRRRRRRQR